MGGLGRQHGWHASRHSFSALLAEYGSLSLVQAKAAAASQSGLPALNVAILRDVVLEPIEPFLAFLVKRMGFELQIRWGAFDNVFQDAAGTGDVVSPTTDVVMIFQRIETLWPRLSTLGGRLGNEEREQGITRIVDHIRNTVGSIRKQTDAIVLWHSFEHSLSPAVDMIEGLSQNGLNGVVRCLNKELGEVLRSINGSYYVDVNRCLARVGMKQFYDRRYWYIARAPYSLEGVKEIAMEDAKYIAAAKGRNKKCLVLDCDNVLWGGVVGEDGVEGIKLGKTHPGSMYVDFQQVVANLAARGVIVALCSKNNESDVWEVFNRHPDMVLKKEDLAAYQINWDDKAANIRKLAQQLNIGLDSMVFVDDSEFETRWVRESIPEVDVILLPKDEPWDYSSILSAYPFLSSLHTSREDRLRLASYRADNARKQLAVSCGTIDEYLKSLDMEVHVSRADKFSIPRIAQLTQKTNQFNLTTVRLNEAQVRALVEREDVDVLCLNYKDQFSDYGIVGVAVIARNGDLVVIDEFMLSCRVLGRAVEDAFLRFCLERGRGRGAQFAIGRYIPTERNMQVKEFYSQRGFVLIEATGQEMRFRLNLSEISVTPSKFIGRVTHEI